MTETTNVSTNSTTNNFKLPQQNKQRVQVEVPVKQGETIWDVQDRIEKRSDPTKTKTSATLAGRNKVITTEYYRQDGKPAGHIFRFDTEHEGKFTTMHEY